MKRLTIHLKRVKKERIDGKDTIKNTITYMVKNDAEAQSIVYNINSTKPRNNVQKWYISNIK